MDGRRLCALLRESGMEPESYSGRGMFGRSCVGVRLEEGDSEFGLALMVSQASLSSALDAVESEGWTADDVEDGIRASHAELEDRRLFRTSRDSLGLGTILYWPGIAWTPECEEGYEESYARKAGDPEACPGCGCLPGDGVTEGCEDTGGCGEWRATARAHGIGLPKQS